MGNRQDKEKERDLQPKRIEFAKQQIEQKGFKVYSYNDVYIKFNFKNAMVTLYPYSGWHTGKTIKDGRGLQNLLKQLTP